MVSISWRLRNRFWLEKTVKLTILITWHKQRLAEGSHAEVFEAFSFREDAAVNCWYKAKKWVCQINTIEVFALNLFKVYPKKMEETEQQLKFTSTTIVGCKSLAAKFIVNTFRLYFTTLLQL